MYLACAEADASFERTVGEVRESVLRLSRGAHRAQCVVLVDRRHAEDRHHRIADELLHGAAVPFDGLPYGLEVA